MTHDIRRYAGWLFTLVLVGALLRGYALTSTSLWLDELFSLRVALLPTLGAAVRAGSIDDMFPPLYPAITYFAVHSSSDFPFALRLPSVIASALSAWPVFELGRALYSARVGLVAAALLMGHWFSVSYAREGRPYALLQLACALVALCALRVLGAARRGEATRAAWIAFAAVGMLTSALHYIGLLFFAFAGLLLGWALRPLRSELRRWVLTIGLCAAAYLPWLSVVLTQISRRADDKVPPAAVSLLRAANDLCARHPLPCLAVLGLGLWASRSGAPRGETRANADSCELKSRERIWLLGLWMLVPPLAMWLLSYAVVPIFTVRNTIIVLPALLIVVARALERIEHSWLRDLPIASGVVALALCADTVLLKELYRAEKEPFLPLVARVLADPEHAPLRLQPRSLAQFVATSRVVLGATPTDATPTDIADGADPAALWVLVRKVDMVAPRGYRLRERFDHTPDRRLPFPGQAMTLAHFDRIAEPQNARGRR